MPLSAMAGNGVRMHTASRPISTPSLPRPYDCSVRNAANSAASPAARSNASGPHQVAPVIA